MPTNFQPSVIDKYVRFVTEDHHHRYLSWDHCFKAFSNSDSPTESHVLQLAFYLASWGMYRGSSGLLQKNHLIHEGATKLIYRNDFNALRFNKKNEVSKGSIQLILQLKKALSEHYRKVPFVRGGEEKKISDTDTLLSKILLGTMACVPAYDQYFVSGLKRSGFKFSSFDASSLNELFDFIETNKKSITESQTSIKAKTGNHYPLMKIIDMYFWQIGFDGDSRKNKKALSQ